MRKHSRQWNIWGRRIAVLLLLCGLLMPEWLRPTAATITYEYKWIKDTTGLPTDDEWHDYFLAWEDLDDKNKVWYAAYHWYTADGYNNYDAGGTHWMEYKAATTLPNSTASSFSSKDCLGHMQIKFAGRDEDNGNSPKYYIRVSKINGGYAYFTRYEPTDKETSADAFTFEKKGDVFQIFVNIGGKADRYLTRDGQYIETTESSSAYSGDKYRAMRVYQRTYTVDESAEEIKDVIGKVTLYEYHWVNTADEMLALARDSSDWSDIILAWEDADGYGTANPDLVWYTKEVWYEEGKANYKNGSAKEGTANDFFYWSNDYLGSDGYGSPYAESFILPDKAGHFQMKLAGWDSDNPISGYKNHEGKEQESPVFNFRFDIGHDQYIYIGNNGFYDSADKVEDYTVQLRLGEIEKEDPYGSVWIINNITAAQDELFTRCKNRFDISNWIPSKYWEFPFRIYTYRPLEYDAIVKSFTIGKGATYSIDRQLIVKKGVTITVEDGGILTVDSELLNNGNIVVKNGGAVIVNEGAYIMAYDQNGTGRISLDGGSLIILDDGKVVCDQGNGALEAKNGATILNRGLLMVGNMLSLNNNSYLKNEANAMLLVGGKIKQERGGIGAFAFSEVASRLSDEVFTYLISDNSKIINEGVINEPEFYYMRYSENAEANTSHIGSGRVDKRGS